VNADGVAEEVKLFSGLDVLQKMKLSGLEKPRVEDFGVYKKYMYKVSSNTDYTTLMNFVVELQKSQVRIGIQKLEVIPAKRISPQNASRDVCGSIAMPFELQVVN
jgi:hypothetical protein